MSKFIAYYLPQFHTIPENDLWWGDGFTEWTNVKKAKPLFRGQYQPRIPSELGYYNLLDSDIIQAQAEMGREYGIDGFCWWHYYFGDEKQLLEKPAKLLLKSPKITMKYFFGWANQSWTGIWHGLDNKILQEQKYLGAKDDELHFYTVLPHFFDSRYINQENKPIFLIYKPYDHPYIETFIDRWQNLAIKNGLNGIYFIGLTYNINKSIISLDGYALQDNYFKVYDFKYGDTLFKKLFNKSIQEFFNQKVYNCDRLSFKKMMSRMKFNCGEKNCFPTILTGWDNTPRSGKNGKVFYDFTPKIFEDYLDRIFISLKDNPKDICFIKSWNEWAEGNYLEPDKKYGRDFLEIFKKFKIRFSS